MPRGTQEALRTQSRQMKVAELILRGVRNQFEICERLGMERSQSTTISRDVRIIREEWKRTVAAKYDEVVGEELAKLELIEKEAWAAWDRSRAKATSSKSILKPKLGRPKVTRERMPQDIDRLRERMIQIGLEVQEKGRDGDPRFLDIVLACMDKRDALLGLDKRPPAPVNVTANVQVNNNVTVEKLAMVRDFSTKSLQEKQRLLLDYLKMGEDEE